MQIYSYAPLPPNRIKLVSKTWRPPRDSEWMCPTINDLLVCQFVVCLSIGIRVQFIYPQPAYCLCPLPPPFPSNQPSIHSLISHILTNDESFGSPITQTWVGETKNQESRKAKEKVISIIYGRSSIEAYWMAEEMDGRKRSGTRSDQTRTKGVFNIPPSNILCRTTTPPHDSHPAGESLGFVAHIQFRFDIRPIDNNYTRTGWAERTSLDCSKRLRIGGYLSIGKRATRKRTNIPRHHSLTRRMLSQMLSLRESQRRRRWRWQGEVGGGEGGGVVPSKGGVQIEIIPQGDINNPQPCQSVNDFPSSSPPICPTLRVSRSVCRTICKWMSSVVAKIRHDHFYGLTPIPRATTRTVCWSFLLLAWNTIVDDDATWNTCRWILPKRMSVGGNSIPGAIGRRRTKNIHPQRGIARYSNHYTLHGMCKKMLVDFIHSFVWIFCLLHSSFFDSFVDCFVNHAPQEGFSE